MIIEIKDLKKAYAGRTVVNIDQLSINAGETIGLVGNNGAGKTTLFRLLLDFIRANKGTIFSKTENVSNSEHWKDYTASDMEEGFLYS
mgnify:CR=1 FL=1